MKPVLYCATTNRDKLDEFRLAFRELYRVELLPGIEKLTPPEENASTFEQNAAIKAVYYSRHCREPVFADDSGLEVDALGGAPGVLSARYAGPQASTGANNALLLARMRGVAPPRHARFVCVIALAHAGHLMSSFRGEVAGELLNEPRGDKGFGYDPLFFCPELGCTFGQASGEQKSRLSHRGKALAAMLGFLRLPSSGNSL